jgi:hypothetical protein
LQYADYAMRRLPNARDPLERGRLREWADLRDELADALSEYESKAKAKSRPQRLRWRWRRLRARPRTVSLDRLLGRYPPLERSISERRDQGDPN